MDPKRQREIASMGGHASQASGRAHQFTTEEARAAGRKGGLAIGANREHMAEIGRKGGKARHAGSVAYVPTSKGWGDGDV